MWRPAFGLRGTGSDETGRLFATGAAWQKRNAGNDLGPIAQRRHESGRPGKFWRVEEQELPAIPAVQGIRPSKRSRDRIAAIDATAALSRKVSDDL
ncbi:MAG: hypothetical protein F4186_08035 [Boseongicola sp. SB0676_bin_33]|uniref:Uncharacterized protein n=1 Tax=Boseongicola sp. SB0664_bin_43 TaxID=2604844 RepID=A0A6B0Y1S9_9RHOB|nr:hypothetical protein [Boseongicola sp. SB0664_bin_43]MYF89301.1 hypothetical protein [Boseongicola sp. SB0676_bin_33]